MRTTLYMPVFSVDIGGDVISVDSEYCYPVETRAARALRDCVGITTEPDCEIVGGFVKRVSLIAAESSALVS